MVKRSPWGPVPPGRSTLPSDLHVSGMRAGSGILVEAEPKPVGGTDCKEKSESVRVAPETLARGTGWRPAAFFMVDGSLRRPAWSVKILVCPDAPCPTELAGTGRELMVSQESAHGGLQPERRPDAMADVPGVCELPLTRAVVQYRDVHEVHLAGGRIEDIGLALVLEGRYASSAEVIDLGSATVKRLDLSAELVVLDWVYEPTLDHVHGLVRRAAGSESSAAAQDLGTYCFALAVSVLDRVGYGPLTRSSILRIGFRDICRDLDLHEGTSVRILMGPGSLARAHLDYDGAALIFRTASHGPDPLLEDSLSDAFPAEDIRRVLSETVATSVEYQVRFPLPLTLREARDVLGRIREGLSQLVARFEVDRFNSLDRQLRTFGPRETLSRLHLRESRTRSVPVRRPSAASRQHVH